jgi:hypothetical protein
MRRRKHVKKVDIPNEPLDEDEQEKIVHTLATEALKQMTETQRLFLIISSIAGSLCILVAASYSNGQKEITQALFSSAMYFSAPLVLKEGKISHFLPHTIVMAALASLLFIWRAEIDTLHGYLCFGNLIIVSGAVYLKLENNSTKKAIMELRASKYRYKSL